MPFNRAPIYWVVLVMLSLLLASTMGGYVYIYDTMDRADGYSVYQTGPAQRCYSFSCWSGKVSYIEWFKMQETSWMVFYEGPQCTGEPFMKWGTGGPFALGDVDMDNSISSMMVWQSSIYPTRGTVDLCPVESALLVHSATGNSAGSSGGNVTFFGDSSDSDEKFVGTLLLSQG